MDDQRGLNAMSDARAGAEVSSEDLDVLHELIESPDRLTEDERAILAIAVAELERQRLRAADNGH